jgi:hypothetical protein
MRVKKDQLLKKRMEEFTMGYPPLRYFALILLLVSMASAADQWVINGSSVYWTNGQGTISVNPHTVHGITNTQYANFSWTGAPIYVNVSFVFEQPGLTQGSVDLLQNVTQEVPVPIQGRVDYSTIVNNVQSYTATNSTNCNIGDVDNLLKFVVNYTENSTAKTTVACFNNYTNISNNYTLYYQKNGTVYVYQNQTSPTWVDITAGFVTTQIAGHTVYTINNVYFTNPTTYQTKITYSVPMGVQGKYDLYLHAGSPSDVVNGIAPVYVQLDPWYNSSYTDRYPINCTLITEGTLIVINGSGGFTHNGEKQIVWTVCGGANLFLYYNPGLSGQYLVANDTVLPMEVEMGNATSYNAIDICTISKAVSIWHLNTNTSITDTCNRNNLTIYSGGSLPISTGMFGNALLFSNPTVCESACANSINNAYTTNAFGLPSGNGASYIQMSVKSQTVTDGAYRRIFGFGETNFDTSSRGFMQKVAGDNKFYLYTPASGMLNSNYELSTTFYDILGYNYNGTDAKIYVNTTLKATQTASNTVTPNVIRIGANYNNPYLQYGGMAYIDELRIFNESKTEKFTNDTYYNTINTRGYGNLEESVSNGVLTVNFVSATPTDLTATSMFAGLYKTQYNVTNLGDTVANASKTYLYFTTNSTTSNVSYFANGTAVIGWRNTTGTNVSDLFNFSLDDNDILPASYNLLDSFTDGQAHTAWNINNNNRLISTRLYNVTNATQYNFVEVMANGTGTINAYYCNSTYTTFDATVSPNCVLYGQQAANLAYNHTHSANSAHKVFIFPINTTTGTVAGSNVKVTPTSYFIFGIQTGSSVDFWYVPNITRTDTTRSSVNLGQNWANQTFTLDAHLHEFTNNNNTYYEYACSTANEGTNTTNITTFCSTIRQDSFNLTKLPPSAAVIHSPTGAQVVGSTILINYSAANSPNPGDVISYYNITLLDANGTYASTIQGNNSLNLTYSWDSTGTAAGSYYVQVTAYDNNSLSRNSQQQFTLIPQTITVNNLSVTPVVGDATYETINVTINVTGGANVTAAALTVVYSNGSVSNPTITLLSGDTSNGVWQAYFVPLNISGTALAYVNATINSTPTYTQQGNTSSFIVDNVPPVLVSFTANRYDYVAPDQNPTYTLIYTDNVQTGTAILTVGGTGFGLMNVNGTLGTNNTYTLTPNYTTAGTPMAVATFTDTAGHIVYATNFTLNVSSYTRTLTRDMQDYSQTLTFPLNSSFNATINYTVQYDFVGNATLNLTNNVTFTDGNITRRQANATNWANITGGITIATNYTNGASKTFKVSYTVDNITIQTDTDATARYVNVTRPNSITEAAQYYKITLLMPSSWAPATQHIRIRSYRTGSWATVGDGNLLQGEDYATLQLYNFTTTNTSTYKDTINVWLDISADHQLEFTVQAGAEDTTVIPPSGGGGGGGGGTTATNSAVVTQNNLPSVAAFGDLSAGLDTFFKGKMFGISNAGISIIALLVLLSEASKRKTQTSSLLSLVAIFSIAIVGFYYGGYLLG